MEATTMKLFAVFSTTALAILLGISVPVYAQQDEPHPQEEKRAETDGRAAHEPERQEEDKRMERDKQDKENKEDKQADREKENKHVDQEEKSARQDGRHEQQALSKALPVSSTAAVGS